MQSLGRHPEVVRSNGQELPHWRHYGKLTTNVRFEGFARQHSLEDH